MTLLREGLLSGRAVALGGGGAGGGASGRERVGGEVGELLASLGARVEPLPGDQPGPESDGSELDDWVRRVAPLDALVFDVSAAFGRGGEVRLQAALAAAWAGVGAVANGAMIGRGGGGEAGHGAARGGKVVLIAPRAGAGEFAEAAAAALESLARTLSVEWARHAITATAVAPGASTTDAELAELVAFLVSPAGDYFSGCRFDLGRLETVFRSG